jgi:serine/threonine protein phosphatase 1
MANLPLQNVLNLSPNRLGRDFMLGDLCGEFELIFRQLRALNFDPLKDRLFCVGHLLTSSGSMTQCVRFVRHPGVFALRTNTEQQLLDLFEEGEPEEAAWAAVAQAHGDAGGWMVEAGRLQRLQIVETMRMLPLAIAIGDRQTQTGLVHGTVPPGMSWREFSSGLSKGDDECVSAALWGGSEIPTAPVAGVGEVYVCYTPDWNLGYECVNIRQIMPGITPQLLRAPVANTGQITKEKK